MTKLRALLEECGVEGSTALTSAFGCYKLTLPAGAWIDVDAAVEALERMIREHGTVEPLRACLAIAFSSYEGGYGRSAFGATDYIAFLERHGYELSPVERAELELEQEEDRDADA